MRHLYTYCTSLLCSLLLYQLKCATQEKPNTFSTDGPIIILRYNFHYTITMQPVQVYRLYSDLKLFTGLESAALTAWKLTVISVMNNASNDAMANTCQVIVIL